MLRAEVCESGPINFKLSNTVISDLMEICKGCGRESSGPLHNGLCGDCVYSQWINPPIDAVLDDSEPIAQRRSKKPQGSHEIVCEDCHGTGLCHHCRGTGYFSSTDEELQRERSMKRETGVLIQGELCDYCRGDGRCSSCDGEGLFSSSRAAKSPS